jgi:glycosyltransferase involved in cell wall biosynthesis
MQATVILPREGPLGGHLDALGVPWMVVPQPAELLNLTRAMKSVSLLSLLQTPYALGKYLVRLKTRLQELAPEILYSNGIKFHFLSSLLSRRMNIPLIWHVRDHWGSRILGFAADRYPELIMANSRATAAKLQDRMKIKDKTVVVYNAVDCDEFSPEGPTIDLGVRRPGEYRIGLPGPLAEIKGQTIFLQAARMILREYPLARFFIIGGYIYDTVKDRAYEADLRKSIGGSGLAGCVEMTGFQESMAPWYRALDIIVNASLVPEGFGRTLLEAMACGKAVTGPDSGGIPEFVHHEKTGLLYSMADARALADSIIRLMRDDPLRSRLGQEGRASAVRTFSAGPHAEAVAAVMIEARSAFDKRRSSHSRGRTNISHSR